MTNVQGEDKESTERLKSQLIEKIAECCMEQGAFNVACKKYAQAS